MTRENAIKQITDILEYFNDRIEKETDPAFDKEIAKKDAKALRMAIKALEQEPMRDATSEERKSTDDYIKSISKPTGVNFWNLEQEPCEDAISRQAAINAMATWDWQELYLPIHFKQLLEELPPVTVQEKTGRWEWVQYDFDPRIGNWHCSECRNILVPAVKKDDVDGIPIAKYCPNCGAKMEVEE